MGDDYSPLPAKYCHASISSSCRLLSLTEIISHQDEHKDVSRGEYVWRIFMQGIQKVDRMNLGGNRWDSGGESGGRTR